jgi:hypothetical protein
LASTGLLYTCLDETSKTTTGTFINRYVRFIIYIWLYDIKYIFIYTSYRNSSWPLLACYVRTYDIHYMSDIHIYNSSYTYHWLYVRAHISMYIYVLYIHLTVTVFGLYWLVWYVSGWNIEDSNWNILIL